jgi:hypothetical protein
MFAAQVIVESKARSSRRLASGRKTRRIAVEELQSWLRRRFLRMKVLLYLKMRPHDEVTA